MRKIAFLGTGNMAQAMVAGLLERGLATPQEIICLGGSGVSARGLAEATGVEVAGSLPDLLSEAQTLIVAFKPYHLAPHAEILAKLTEGKLVLSVLAGKTLAQLAHAFPKARAIVRCMPNTPSRIGAGVTGWCSGQGLAETDRNFTESLLAALGVAIEIPESQMDALTAVSGCGPAYVFEFTAALREAGVAAGLSHEVATVLAIETVLGAARLMARTGTPPETLRNQVTSPNGVTFAGLQRLEAGKFRDLIRETVAVAKHRSAELSTDQ